MTKAVHTKRRFRSSKKQASISDDSGYVRERRLSENQQAECEEESRSQRSSRRKRSRWELYASARKATFPFLMKSLKKQHLPIRKHQILEVVFIYVFICICMSFYNVFYYIMYNILCYYCLLYNKMMLVKLFICIMTFFLFFYF